MIFSCTAFATDVELETGQMEITFTIGSVTSGDMAFEEGSGLFLDHSYTTGVKLAYYLNRLAAIEASFTVRFDQAFYISDTSITEDPSEFIKEDFINYHFNLGLLYNMGDLVHVPFISVGVGLTTLNYSDKFLVPAGERRFTIFGALGYKYYISESLAARLEICMNAFDYENLMGENNFFMNWILQAGVTIKLK
jgi:hypothetical protein